MGGFSPAARGSHWAGQVQDQWEFLHIWRRIIPPHSTAQQWTKQGRARLEYPARIAVSPPSRVLLPVSYLHQICFPHPVFVLLCLCPLCVMHYGFLPQVLCLMCSYLQYMCHWQVSFCVFPMLCSWPHFFANFTLLPLQICANKCLEFSLQRFLSPALFCSSTATLRSAPFSMESVNRFIKCKDLGWTIQQTFQWTIFRVQTSEL